MKKVIVISASLCGEDTTRKDKEIINLIGSLDMEAVRFYTQNINEINKNTYIGSGKISEIITYIRPLEDVDSIVFNCDLSPLQFRTLKDLFKKEIYDRTGIILQIFAQRAKTKEAKLQVEIATLQYLRARLVEKEANFSQVTSGGGAHNKGSGEKQIDIDRYKYRVLLAQKNAELESLVSKRAHNRQRRSNCNLPIVAIVGYTNAGKSTLLNTFIEADKKSNEKKVLQEDRLFATLETSTRYIDITKYPSFLLTDTVGFIDNLPTTLIKAFRSTLEEIKEADLLIQVVDVSDNEYKNQIITTNNTLKEIGVDENIPMIYLYNKVDKIDHYPFIPDEHSLFTSLTTTDDIDDICKLIMNHICKDWEKVNMFLPFSENLYALQKSGFIQEIKENEDGYYLTILVNERTKKMYSKFIID